ncbi:hypothetical protein [Pseudomonas corrugata]|uniref:hypothetical protein n=1 Tax=Pseudomonas corrugata TaxID=47879 RepID=UPI001586E973|nr:hypothetical protein [Pseudomonas corrugata]MCI0992637.1 hypothetical protein [Pseudomonas corrugata]NUT65376.1 hypothetical protein [Pseudomonas corrugata]
MTTDIGIAKQMHAAKTNQPAMQYSAMSVEDVTSLRKVHQLKAEGLNQKQIAEKMGISKQTVHDPVAPQTGRVTLLTGRARSFCIVSKAV